MPALSALWRSGARLSVLRRWGWAVVLATGLAQAAPALSPLASPASPAPASPWPTRPVRILVGFPGGSSPDLVARALAEPLAQALGQPVIVENKVGASGNIAAEALARATDQHTLGLLINGNMTIARQLNPRLGFDPLKDLAPVSLIGTAPLVLAVAVATPGQGPADWLRAAQANGQRWSYGSPGVGTVAHLGMERLKARHALAAVHVPYAGNPQVINAMLAGQIDMALLPPAMAAAQARAGKLKVIGVTSPVRSSLAPEWPSLSELGLSGFELEIWDALAAPASMPAALRDRLARVVSQLVRSSPLRDSLYQQGWQVVGSSPEGLQRRIQSDTQALGRVIQDQHITLD